MDSAPFDHPKAYLQPGAQALLRFRRLGSVSVAMPTTVVHDDPGHTALYMRPGTPMKRRVMPDGSPIRRSMSYMDRLALPHVVGDSVWGSQHALIFFRKGEAHDVRLFWSEDEWEFRGWYVNLQTPVRRTHVGFDTADHVVDSAVSPNLEWRWKDENEFADAVSIGRFSAEEATAIRAEGARAIEAIESRMWPFNGEFNAWRPPSDWPIPEMPENWNE